MVSQKAACDMLRCSSCAGPAKNCSGFLGPDLLLFTGSGFPKLLPLRRARASQGLQDEAVRPIARIVAVAHRAMTNPEKTTMARVLVADDNQDGADTLAALFASEGHQVEVAYDGRAAIEAGATFGAELALIDTSILAADGYEVARQLQDASPGTVLIAMAGSPSEESRAKAFRAGFAAHFVKPFSWCRLMAFLDAGAPCTPRQAVPA